jgi:PTH1 family peptidyl-tRNA hydrolase
LREGSWRAFLNHMKLIAGLGNPGKKYETTRHNFGFILIDELADRWNGCFENSSKFKGEYCEIRHPEHQKIFLLKPQTFMNLSGQSVGLLAQFYKLGPQDILILHDEIELPFGRLRFARKGRSAGHNGLKSVQECLGTQEYHRLKLGVGRPVEVQQDLADHVLQKFSKNDFKILPNIIQKAADGVETYLSDGIDRAMNLFN